MGDIRPLTMTSFRREVLQSDKPVLVEFTAEWSGVCRCMSPVVERTARTMPEVRFCRVDVESEPELAGRNRVAALPTFAVFENGQRKRVSTGARTEQELKDLIF